MHIQILSIWNQICISLPRTAKHLGRAKFVWAVYSINSLVSVETNGIYQSKQFCKHHMKFSHSGAKKNVTIWSVKSLVVITKLSSCSVSAIYKQTNNQMLCEYVNCLLQIFFNTSIDKCKAAFLLQYQYPYSIVNAVSVSYDVLML